MMCKNLKQTALKTVRTSTGEKCWVIEEGEKAN